MKTIGIYLGQSNDNTENIESQVQAWGEYLSEFQVDLFGSAEISKQAGSKYSYISTTSRSPTTPLGKIVGAMMDCREYIEKRNPDTIAQIWKYNVYAPGVVLGTVNRNVKSVTRFTGDTFDLFPRWSSPTELLGFLFGDIVLGQVIGKIPLVLSDRMIVFGPRGKSLVTSPPFVPVLGISESAVEVIPPSPDISDRFHPVTHSEKQRLRKELNIWTDKTICLFVGRLTKKKGMEFLLRVLSHLGEDREKFQFILVGKGPFEDFFDKNYPDDEVRAVGYINYESIHEFYKAADVYVHPSGYEGVPLVILEALSCELPVIARDAGDVGLVCDKPVTTSEEMARRLLNQEYDDKWSNKELFLVEYQKNTLHRLFKDV